MKKILIAIFLITSFQADAQLINVRPRDSVFCWRKWTGVNTPSELVCVRVIFKEELSVITDSTGYKVMVYNPTNGKTRYFSTQGVGAPGGSIPLSSLSGSATGNTINNAAYSQLWQWNSLAGGTGLNLQATTTAATGGTQNLFLVDLYGNNANASETSVTAKFSNSHGGTTPTNYAVSAVANGANATNIAGMFTANGSGSATNRALIVPASGGNVGLGTSTPNSTSILHTVGAVRMATLGTASADTTTNKPLGINSSGDIIPMTYWPGGGGGGGSVAGSNEEIQFNNSGAFGASDRFKIATGSNVTTMKLKAGSSQSTNDLLQIINSSGGVEAGFTSTYRLNLSLNAGYNNYIYVGNIASLPGSIVFERYDGNYWATHTDGTDVRFMNNANQTFHFNQAIRIDNGAATYPFRITGYAAGEYFRIGTYGETEWNYSQGNANFIFATSGNANTLKVDGANDRIGIKTGSPTSTLQVAGSFSGTYTTTATNLTLDISHFTVNVSASATITLPTAAGITGREYTIINSHSSNITLNTTSSQTIGLQTTATSVSVPSDGGITVVSDGSNWKIKSQF